MGPVVATHAGVSLTLGGRKQRGLLTRLALAANSPVSAEHLIDDLWIDPPRNPAHALQAHVSRLRALLPVRLAWEGGGYRLVGDFDLDAATLADHAERARALMVDNPARAAAFLDEAAALWVGNPLIDVPNTPAYLGALDVELDLPPPSAAVDLTAQRYRIHHAVASWLTAATTKELGAFLRQGPRMRHVPLDGLSTEDTAALITAEFPGATPGDQNWVWETGGGNPCSSSNSPATYTPTPIPTGRSRTACAVYSRPDSRPSTSRS